MRIVAGRFRGAQLYAPEGATTRPTSDRLRERLFNILTARRDPPLENAIVADIFAGTGALGLEALSRGASKAIFVENAPAAQRVLTQNIAKLNLQKDCQLINGDATALPRLGFGCDLIFVDPPYDRGLVQPCLNSLIKGAWLKAHTTIVVEKAKHERIDLTDAFYVADERVQGKSALLLIKQKLA